MQISIEIINVGTPQTVPTKGGKSYQMIEVAYKKDGAIEGKKLVDFVNKEVFKAVQDLEQGDKVTVTTEKGEPNAQGKSFWQWTAISPQGDVPVSVTPTAAASGGGTSKTYTSNYPTNEERAATQVMIVRQSSLGHAVALLGNKAKVPDVIDVAKQFEAYVMGKESKSATEELLDMDDDIPL